MSPLDHPSHIVGFRSPISPRNCFFSVALIDLATLTWDYYWDGITFALQIEKVARDAGKLWDELTVVYCKGRTEADTTFGYFNPTTDCCNLSRVSLDELDREIASIGGGLLGHVLISVLLN